MCQEQINIFLIDEISNCEPYSIAMSLLTPSNALTIPSTHVISTTSNETQQPARTDHLPKTIMTTLDPLISGSKRTATALNVGDDHLFLLSEANDDADDTKAIVKVTKKARVDPIFGAFVQGTVGLSSEQVSDVLVVCGVANEERIDEQ